MKHIAKKCGLPEARVPIILEHYGNSGGPSVPLVLTQSLPAMRTQTVHAMLLGYGVGLSWGSAVVHIDSATKVAHGIYEAECLKR
jgi:3-oxoacyl-[acyl-carrier-protein] synthase III